MMMIMMMMMIVSVAGERRDHCSHSWRVWSGGDPVRSSPPSPSLSLPSSPLHPLLKPHLSLLLP